MEHWWDYRCEMLLRPDQPRASVPPIPVLAVAAVTGDFVLGNAMAGNLCSGLYAAGWAQYCGRRARLAFIRPNDALRLRGLQRRIVLLGLSP